MIEHNGLQSFEEKRQRDVEEFMLEVVMQHIPEGCPTKAKLYTGPWKVDRWSNQVALCGRAEKSAASYGDGSCVR